MNSLITTYNINTKKQNNGIWGMPLQCYEIDKYVVLSEEKELLKSAIIMGIAETYPLASFKIFWSDDAGFVVSITIKTDDIKMISIKYENYKLIENTLYHYESPRVLKIEKILDDLNESQDSI